MATIPTELMTEDWKKEFEKIILTKKYAKASSIIGIASSTPDIFNVRMAYGHVIDYVTAIPLPQDDNKINVRKGLLDELDKIGLILNGSDTETTKQAEKSLGVFRARVRDGLKMVDQLQELPKIVNNLRDILIKAGEFATSSGLRVSLSKKRKYGHDRLLEEENFDDLEV